MRHRVQVLLIGTFVMLLTVLLLTTVPEAQTTVDFVVPTGTGLATGPQGDVLTFLGGAAGGSTLGSCGPVGTFPVQYAMHGAGGTPTSVGVLLTSTTTALRAGTRLRNLSFVGNCVIGNSVYHYYRGTVE